MSLTIMSLTVSKLEIATELMKEGLTVEQIARVLKLPLELVKEQLEKPKSPN